MRNCEAVGLSTKTLHLLIVQLSRTRTGNTIFARFPLKTRQIAATARFQLKVVVGVIYTIPLNSLMTTICIAFAISVHVISSHALFLLRKEN